MLSVSLVAFIFFIKHSQGYENNYVASLSRSENLFIFNHPMCNTALSVNMGLANPSFVRVKVGLSSGYSGHFQLSVR